MFFLKNDYRREIAAVNEGTVRMKPNATEERYSVPAVVQTVRILYFLKERERAGASEIARSLEITRSYCFGILKTLQSSHFLSFDEHSKKYELGPAFLNFSQPLSQENLMKSAAKPHMRNFVKETGMSIFLIERVNYTRLLVVDREESSDDVRITLAIGTRIPITHSASGRAALAFLPAPEIDDLVRAVRVAKLTPRTIVDPEAIRADLGAVRRRGFSVAFGENMLDVNAIAAPVFDPSGMPKFVVSTLGTASTFDARKAETFGKAIAETGERITAAIGGRRPKIDQAFTAGI